MLTAECARDKMIRMFENKVEKLILAACEQGKMTCNTRMVEGLYHTGNGNLIKYVPHIPRLLRNLKQAGYDATWHEKELESTGIIEGYLFINW